MKKDRWDQVKELFQQALEHREEERPDFIREVSADDTTLRVELESLLSSHDAAGTFMSRPPGAEAAAVLSLDADAPLVGKRLGPYRVVRRVGRGGTGSVYLAVRDDDEFQLRVALKVVRRGMASEEMLQRFRSERQILASIDHPNIARLLDGGSTEDGLPYFVMEYIEGEPLHEYCDSNRLQLGERIALFRSICDAVSLAHQNLVVHRDLKPGNILVTPDGVPKLLDFGIAKLLNPELSSDRREPTLMELRVMTPEYASPEQMQGKAVTTASDIYSLGVLLYELLTGHSPYALSNLPLHEMEFTVCTREPDRPSEVVEKLTEEPGRDGGVREITPESVARARQSTPERLRRELNGDLDNIVLKALRKEPPRRYSSVEKLADDLANHLEGRPVAARPDTFSYRTGKFLRRHRVPAAIAATALVFGIVLTGTIFLQSRRVVAERDRAEHAAAEALAVSAFLQEVLAAADPIEGMGREVSVLDAIDEAVPRIGTSFVEQPGTEAAIRHTIGQTFARLGRFDEADEQLLQALALRRQLLGNDHAEIAATLNALGEVRYDRGDFDGAERLYDEALAMRRRLFGGQHAAVATSLDNLGNIYQEHGDDAAAEKAYRDALAIRRVELGPDHKDVAASLNNVATILHDREEYEAAEEMYMESLVIARRVLGESHPEVATSLNNLAVLLHDQQKLEEAEPVYREALAIARQTLGAQHPGVVVSINNLAVLLTDMQRFEEAEGLLDESLRISVVAWGEGAVQVGYVYRQMGSMELERGDTEVALDDYERALGILDTQLPTDHPEMIFAQAGRGRALTRLARYAAGEEGLLNAYNATLSRYGPEDDDLIRFAGWIADLYDAWGQPQVAARYHAVSQRDAIAVAAMQITTAVGRN